MLKPLFSPNRDHVGWIEPGRFVFDTDMAYVAFIAAGSAWSGGSGSWLGPVVDAVTIIDTEGRPVAWNPDAVPRGMGQPMRPVATVRTVTPPRPVRPVYPKRPPAAPYRAGGWSEYAFLEWVALGDPPPPAEEESGEPVTLEAGAEPDAVETPAEQDRPVSP